MKKMINDNNKSQWRQFLKERRREIFDLDGAGKSAIIARRVLTFCKEEKYRCIMCYLSFDSEVETNEIVENLLTFGKKVCVPKCLDNSQMMAVAITGWGDLKPAKFGMLEPINQMAVVEPQEIDLCIVPGLGFSEDGGRIGFGAGFYDRYLPKMTGEKVGLAFDEMVFAAIPQEVNDQRVEWIITDKRVIEVGEKKPVQSDRADAAL